jgi:hypothetical protein
VLTIHVDLCGVVITSSSGVVGARTKLTEFIFEILDRLFVLGDGLFRFVEERSVLMFAIKEILLRVKRRCDLII